MTYDSYSYSSSDSHESINESSNRIKYIRREIKLSEMNDSVTDFLIEKGETMIFDYFKYVNTHDVVSTIAKMNGRTNSRPVTLTFEEQHMYFDLIDFVRNTMEKPLNISSENIQYLHDVLYNKVSSYYVDSSSRYYVDPVCYIPFKYYNETNETNKVNEDTEDTGDSDTIDTIEDNDPFKYD
jgi:hypothetical protein